VQVNFWYSGYDIIELKGIFENTFNFVIFSAGREKRASKRTGLVVFAKFFDNEKCQKIHILQNLFK